MIKVFCCIVEFYIDAPIIIRKIPHQHLPCQAACYGIRRDLELSDKSENRTVVVVVIMYYSSCIQYYRKIHCLTSDLHVKFHARNRYCTNREAMSAISVFQVKFNVEFTRQAVNFS